MLFLLINLTLAGGEVDLVKRDEVGFEVEFVAAPENDEGGDGDVGGDKCIGLEGDEGVITLEEGYDGGGYEGEVCTPWLEWGLVGQVVTGVALDLESLHESTVGGILANGFLSRAQGETDMCVQTMHIQVMAPKVETRLTNQPKTRNRVECL